MKITSITKAQAARFEEWSKKYIEIGLSTAPADFDRATAAALKAYKLCNLDQPMIILRMGSPSGATLGGFLAWAFLREFVTDKVRSQVESQVWSQVESQVRSQVESQVRSQVGSQVRSQVRSAVYNDRGGAFWASWIAYVGFLRDVLGWRDPVLERFSIDEDLAESCGWVWWHENVLAISDRPSIINRDERGRLHCENGPSIAYRDGWKLYHWHGVVIPEYVIERPQELSATRIETEQNAEVRRVMLERYGMARFLHESGAQLIHKDQSGQLYRKDLAGDEPLVMVRVLNPTPEPDGTLSESEARAAFGDAIVDANLLTMTRLGFAAQFRHPRFKEYTLRVPPSCKTATEAVAWTFDMKPNDYAPALET